MINYNIFLRRKTGKLQFLTEAQRKIERRVSFFLGGVSREFQTGILGEDNLEKEEERNFIFNMDNGRALGFRVDENFKYADVTPGGEGMKMMVRISGDKD